MHEWRQVDFDSSAAPDVVSAEAVALAMACNPVTAQSRRAFDQLTAASKELRAAVFMVCSERVSVLLSVVEETSARRIDIKMARALGTIMAPGKIDKFIETHSVPLAAPPRMLVEVLVAFHGRGWISLDEGVIRILNRAALRNLAEQCDRRPRLPSKGVLT